MIRLKNTVKQQELFPSASLSKLIIQTNSEM